MNLTNMKNLFCILLLLVTLSNIGQAQTLKAFLKAADEAVIDKDHYNALYYLSEAVKFDTTDLSLKYKLGESAMTFNAYTIAENEFQYIQSNDTINEYPLSSFYLADMQQQQGKYNEAKRNYELFISENDGDLPNYIIKAEKEIEAINWAKDKKDNPRPGVTIEHLGLDVNSPYSDFGAIEKGEELYYTSLRYNEEDGNHPNRLYSKILRKGEDPTLPKDSLDKLNQTEDRFLDDEYIEGVENTVGQRSIKRKIIPDSEENNNFHEAHSSFNADGTKMYYTLCTYLNSLELRCDLYVKAIKEDGSFGKSVKLPSSINSTSHTSTQPNIATNIATGKETLYFVSNREGGNGGLDIWFTEVNEDSYSEPLNLESLNTTGDDISPFFHASTNTLYFSSNGYMGMGGFDVYKSSMVDDNYEEPSNLEAPTNTSFNDIYYTLNDEGTTGYLSSNRTGSLFLEESYEACCYDVYKAKIEEILITLDALTFDETSGEELLGARVRIFDAISGELLYENLNELENNHAFELKCGREYTIITDKEGFTSDTTSISLKDCKRGEELIKKIYLKPTIVDLEVLTFVQPEMKPINGSSVTLYDLTDPSVEPITVTEANSHLFNYKIIAGREYKIVAKHAGYQNQILTFKASDIVDGKITKKVYFDVPVISLNTYLPVAVYFDNDRPDRRSRKIYTNSSYTDTYYPYIAKKDEFKREFTKSMSGDIKSNSISDLDYFFETDVKGGFERMQLFIAKLSERLAGGEAIEISLKGFASPRAANKYNLALGQRRIWTIKNELKQYSGGKLKPYIDSGKLRVVEVSYGEEASPKSISDSFGNSRLSVYSVEASRQRKAEIVRIRVIN